MIKQFSNLRKSPKSILNILNSPNYKKKKMLVCEPTRQTASSTTLKKKNESMHSVLTRTHLSKAKKSEK